MFGEIDLPHPASADLVKDEIAAELESLVLSRSQFVGVEARDEPDLYQAFEHFAGAVGVIPALCKPTRNPSSRSAGTMPDRRMRSRSSGT